MTDTTGELVPGTLEMLVLKTVELEPLHAWGITVRIEQISQGVFRVNPGSLFPALKRMVREGLLREQWRETENNRRAKYYSITKAGLRKLGAETEDWDRRIAAVARILEAR
jgi:PadR family transcriptional regulator, regulatory protein PadR